MFLHFILFVCYLCRSFAARGVEPLNFRTIKPRFTNDFTFFEFWLSQQSNSHKAIQYFAYLVQIYSMMCMNKYQQKKDVTKIAILHNIHTGWIPAKCHIQEVSHVKDKQLRTYANVYSIFSININKLLANFICLFI